jgi:hypothetical protein
MALVSMASWAAHTPKWEEHTINFPANKNVAYRVGFSYVGKNYLSTDNADQSSLEKQGKASLDVEERFILDIVSRNASGDQEKILELWPEAERRSIKSSMASKDASERNSAFFRNIEATRLISVVRFGDYFLFVVEHEVKGINKYMKIYPALSSGGKYFLTNALHGDLFYEKLLPDMLAYFKPPVLSNDR